MTIKVFIPTYKRLNSLQAVLYSLIKTYSPNVEYRYICYVVNNYPENRFFVDEIVNKTNTLTDVWLVKAIHRENTIPPIQNWYGAISEYSVDGDIVFLQGDDDLFLPESIRYRVKTILNEKADLLLTKHIGGVLFYDNSYDISIDNFKINSKSEKLENVYLDRIWSAIFIGNNTYKMSPLLREAFVNAMNWCDEQTWLSYDQRTLMYPIYIPIALNRLNGKVINSNQDSVIRSMNIDECRRALWNFPGWNSGFLHLAFLGILKNKELVELKVLDKVRELTNNYVALWYWTFFFDPRISKSVRKETFKRIGKPTFTFKSLIDSIVFFTKGVFSEFRIYNWLKGIIKTQKKIIDSESFIDSLYRNEK
jgi:hypothetical protein